jgi:hypothetical protein
MNPHGKRARLGAVLVAVAAALALVALPGVAAGHGSHNDPATDAGTIESFDQETGVLTIALTEGGSISGLVTPRTHIHCDNGWHRGRHHMRHGRRRASASHDHGSENRHSGQEESSDHGGEAGTQASGDNPPGHDGTAPGRSEGPGKGAEHSARCTTEDLTEGATVRFADLVLVNGKAIFRMIALPAVQLPAVQGDEEGEGGTPPSE